MTLMIKRAARLFARPSFVEGMARVLDLGSTLNTYNIDDSPKEADYEALRSDWAAVADDLYFAIFKFENEEKIESNKKIVSS